MVDNETEFDKDILRPNELKGLRIREKKEAYIVLKSCVGDTTRWFIWQLSYSMLRRIIVCYYRGRHI